MSVRVDGNSGMDVGRFHNNYVIFMSGFSLAQDVSGVRVRLVWMPNKNRHRTLRFTDPFKSKESKIARPVKSQEEINHKIINGIRKQS